MHRAPRGSIALYACVPYMPPNGSDDLSSKCEND